MYGLGYRPDPPDARDYRLVATPEAQPPAQFSRQALCGPVRYQGNEGICVGFSTAGMLDLFEHMEGRSTVLSPRYLYYLSKQLDGDGVEGTTFRQSLKVCYKVGACLEGSLPFQAHQSVDPNRIDGLAGEAEQYRIQSYARVATVEDMEAALYHNGPVLVGLAVYEYWMRNTDGVLPMPEEGMTPVGGHALLGVGYDRNQRRVRLRNSWSDQWGDGGYAWLPYEYLSKYGGDIWTAVDTDPNPPPGLAIVVPSTWAGQERVTPSLGWAGGVWKRLWTR